MLAIRPDLVKEHRTLSPMDVGFGFEPAYRGWITQERTKAGAEAPGHLGDPRHADAGKGEFLFETFADGVAKFLDRVASWDGESWEPTT